MIARFGRKGGKGYRAGGSAVHGPEVEVGAEADGEDEVSVEGVLEGGGEEGARSVVGECEEGAADEGHGDGERVVEDDVTVAEGGGGGGDGEWWRGEERRVSMKEEGAEDDFLGVHGNEGIAEHDEEPESGSVSWELEEALWLEDEECGGDEDGGECEAERDAGESVTELRGVPECAAVEASVFEEEDEADGGGGDE